MIGVPSRAASASFRVPALRESKRRLQVAAGAGGDRREIVAAIENDPALTLAVLRHANDGPFARSIAGVREAVEVLSRGALLMLADACPTFDFFGQASRLDRAAARFRVHALAVQRLAARVATHLGREDLDAITATATLHDIGKLHFAAWLSDDDVQVEALATTDERLRRERELFGADHARVGAALARSWKLPAVVCEGIECHHDEQPHGIASLVALANLLARFAASDPIELDRLAEVAGRGGLGREALAALLYELPDPTCARTERAERCPLSEREIEIIRALRDGKVGKQIALELGLSESTVRSHLHRIYGRLGVADRAQAVLAASARDWL